jgi:hypothetical protein
MGKLRNAYRILVGKSERGRPLRRPKRGWDDNIKVDNNYIAAVGVGWIQVVEDKVQW